MDSFRFVSLGPHGLSLNHVSEVSAKLSDIHRRSACSVKPCRGSGPPEIFRSGERMVAKNKTDELFDKKRPIQQECPCIYERLWNNEWVGMEFRVKQ